MIHRSLPGLVRPLAFTLMVAIGTGAARAGSLFSNPVFPVGYRPISVLAADLNRDGRGDVVTVGSVLGELSVLLGREEGEFRPELRIPVTAGMTVAAAGDFNQDSRADLVVASGDPQGPGLMAILLGHGDGTFSHPAFFDAGNVAYDLAVADFNRDGKLDVAVLNFNSTGSTLLGRGDGTFEPRKQWLGGFGILSVAMTTADFNRDGVADLALASTAEDYPELTPGTVMVLKGVGDGSFTSFGSLATRSGAVDVATADFNRDGRADLAASEANGLLAIFQGRGDGTFGAALELPSGTGAGPLIAADLNADSLGDLAVAGRSPAGVATLIGRGDGSFNPGVRSEATGDPVGLVAGDFDGDPGEDLVLADRNYSLAVLLSGHGDGSFGPTLRAATGFRPSSLAVADLDRDGESDLVAGNRGSDDVSVLRGRGGGTFEPEARYPAGDSPEAVLAADFNADGAPDLAVGNLLSRDISIRLGRGDGGLGSENRIAAGSGPTGLVSGDFNLDGRIDLAAATPDAGEVLVFPGRGDGGFDPGPPARYGGVHLLARGDFNNDGRPDLAAANASDPHIAMLIGRGDGTFITPSPPFAGHFGITTSLVSGDLDGDGLLDAVLARAFAPGALLLFRGRGDGTFEDAAHFDASQPSSLALADFDQDRAPDLAVAESSAGTVLILRGLRGGGFGPLARFVAGGELTSVVAADFNHDGWPDLAVTDVQLNEIRVLLSRGIPGRVPNRPPIAEAGADIVQECLSRAGATVVLVGTGSSDPDSTPGTRDDIVSMEWSEGPESAPVVLGTGEILPVTLSEGVHSVRLRVTDHAGATGVDTLSVIVTDSTAPNLALTVTPGVLWPPDNRMVEIQASVVASDACSPATVVFESVEETESPAGPGTPSGDREDIQGAVPGEADFRFSLRARRSGRTDLRVYTVTYRAADASGNLARAAAVVYVPHDFRPARRIEEPPPDVPAEGSPARRLRIPPLRP